mmetsp:Transcript_5199/g.11755  ORF Transcript_5199/g.11755 Transcript_5199/m.11755 type:complete len:101 (-) Transcript_5199:1743-2045(-)
MHIIFIVFDETKGNETFRCDSDDGMIRVLVPGFGYVNCYMVPTDPPTANPRTKVEASLSSNTNTTCNNVFTFFVITSWTLFKHTHTHTHTTTHIRQHTNT